MGNEDLTEYADDLTFDLHCDDRADRGWELHPEPQEAPRDDPEPHGYSAWSETATELLGDPAGISPAMACELIGFRLDRATGIAS